MKVLFVSNDLIAGSLAHRLKKEGHEVKLYILSKYQRNNFANLVDKTNDWRKELSWVGRDGLIVFDDVGFGKIQDGLRKKGFNVFGGSFLGDKLELDREFGQKIFKELGMKTVPLRDFDTIGAATRFVQKNKGPWVVKQNGHASKSLNYVGIFKDGRDVVSVLENYQKVQSGDIGKISLQKKIFGVEIGVARYFNGNDWVGPLEMNIEYKKFFVGDLGPSTSEMGTLAWYDDNENNKLFQATLARLKPYLREAKFIGDIDINCIVNSDGAFPLEATPRFGSPAIHLHTELNKSPWGDFLSAVARGSGYNLKWHKGFGIVTLLALPPFPYLKHNLATSSIGTDIHFLEKSASYMDHIHFEEVSWDFQKKSFFVSDSRGYVLYVTAVEKSVELARKSIQERISKIVLPKAFYRNDIGVSFLEGNAGLLKKWGYL